MNNFTYVTKPKETCAISGRNEAEYLYHLLIVCESLRNQYIPQVKKVPVEQFHHIFAFKSENEIKQLKFFTSNCLKTRSFMFISVRSII